ncbi:MAG: hypothetical protein ACREP3_06405, partial [Candidatus Binatia bacterium]
MEKLGDCRRRGEDAGVGVAPKDLEKSYQTFLPAWDRLPLVPAAAVQTMLNFATHPSAKAAGIFHRQFHPYRDQQVRIRR